MYKILLAIIVIVLLSIYIFCFATTEADKHKDESFYTGNIKCDYSNPVDTVPANEMIMFMNNNNMSKYNDGIIYNSMYYTDNTFENTAKGGIEYTPMLPDNSCSS